ncbi:HAD family hydrolase [Methanosarcina mazei]|jgi:putative hydrolase of the HAD superfamily|uniref:HAD family hydrolase n=1 Tax=Methanosarcina mazei TaxID=2209 RepID=A0A0F8SB24_METMZ|nr:HAD family hydrolase [Methanosarcina mazei]KKF98767.1 HAD family hydrolase [Methanosarcina mazei]KKH87320.1 HAD family hydrolase [Methanosarcina mazei]
MGGKNISRNDEADPKGGTVTFLGDPLEAGEDVFESCQIKGVIFDCYQTLIDIHTEEHRIETYETVSAWLAYHGVKIKPEKLWDTYVFKVEERMKDSKEIYPEIRVEEIFAEICQENSIWKIDEKSLGIETSRVFRAASIRKLRPFPQSIKLIENCINIPKCIISNGQRVFSELELRFLGLYDYFDFVIFSSDVGYKKPDLRLFMTALKKMELELEPKCVMSLGDSYENEILPARKLGMQAMTIQEAWKHFGIIE